MKLGDAAIVAIVSDTHINSTVAVMCPEIIRDDGGTETHSLAQKWVWEQWLLYWRYVYNLKKRTGFPVISVVNGDVVDDNNHKTTQLVSKNPAIIMSIAEDTLAPAVDVGDFVFVTRGTEAHTGPSACLDELAAKTINAIPDRHSHSWWWLRLMVGGKKIDIAHHPIAGSRREYTKHTPAGVQAIDTMMKYVNAGEKPPDLVVRSHNHVYSDSGNTYKTRGIITESWQLQTSFAHRIGQYGVQPIGGLICIAQVGKKIDVRRMSYWPTPDPPVTLEDIS